MMFKHIATENPAMLSYTRKDIRNFLLSHDIQDPAGNQDSIRKKWYEHTPRNGEQPLLGRRK